jgi:beta-lactamase class A
MVVAFEQIKNGKLHENDILSQDKDALYKKFNLASASAETTAPTKTPEEIEKNKITLSVNEALEKMIIISDNNAALLLSERVRLLNVASFLDMNGFLESKLGLKDNYPTTTPYDIALFFKKLYRGELANKEYTDKMLVLLKRQRLNGKLPKYLPDELVIAHKTGELDEFTHDAGIVYAPTGDYIIALLSESDNRLQAEERISNVSKAVYEYFVKIETP